MKTGKFNVVTDGNYGSTGKGLVATALAAKYRPKILTNTNMANAGHSAVNTDGSKFIAKALPSPSILRKWLKGYEPQIMMGATSAFDLDRLLEEIAECGANYSLSIHPRAGVITDAHKQAEQTDSEGPKHIASTMQGCGTFLADKVLRKRGLLLARDYAVLDGYMPEHIAAKLPLPHARAALAPADNMAMLLHWLMKTIGYTALHEGSQGFSLDISHGHSYPHCTSRGTTAIQNMADMGVSPNMLGDVYLVIRPYPIRVGNVVEDGKTVGYSGDCYPDQEETTWAAVAAAAEIPDSIDLTTTELTTVTKRLRRVYTFSKIQLQQAAIINGATRIALNFANYIDWSCYGCNDFSKLPYKVTSFINMVEDITGLPVTVVGTGPQTDHVCFLD